MITGYFIRAQDAFSLQLNKCWGGGEEKVFLNCKMFETMEPQCLAGEFFQNEELFHWGHFF